jgi:hypothetical protein
MLASSFAAHLYSKAENGARQLSYLRLSYDASPFKYQKNQRFFWYRFVPLPFVREKGGFRGVEPLSPTSSLIRGNGLQTSPSVALFEEVVLEWQWYGLYETGPVAG